MRHLVISLLLLATHLGTYAQTVSSDEPRKVKIEKAQSLEGRLYLGPDVRLLKGDVVFSHDGAQMYCDSAFFNSVLNSLDAYGRIHIARGDSVHLYGDQLVYTGNDKTARMKGNVVLIKDSLTLRTDELDYYLDQDLAMYYTGGETVTNKDTLRSIVGKYFARTDLMQFSQEVEVVNEKFVINSDTLEHNTRTRLSHFFGPTEITGDSNYLYCEYGWYDHLNDRGLMKKQARYANKNQQMHGDSMFYDRKMAYGKVYHNIEMRDTAQHMFLRGHFAHYEEATEFALVTQQAVFGQYDAKGDTLYMHADTLMSEKVMRNDTSMVQFLRAYHGVRTWRTDLQHLCDSLVYSLADSTIELHGGPIVWAEGNQISADFVKVFTRNSQIERIEFKGQAFAVAPEDTAHYNQLKGTDMIAYFADGQLQKVHVTAKGEVIYMVKDKDKLTGMNRAESDKVWFYIVDKKLDGVLFPTKSKGSIYPIDQVAPADKRLPQFVWYEDIRPQNANDIFRRIPKEQTNELNRAARKPQRKERP